MGCWLFERDEVELSQIDRRAAYLRHKETEEAIKSGEIKEDATKYISNIFNKLKGTVVKDNNSAKSTLDKEAEENMQRGYLINFRY